MHARRRDVVRDVDRQHLHAVRLAQRRGLERPAHRPHHAARHDDHVDAGRLHAAEHLDRARRELASIPRQRAVEVGGDDLQVARERVGELEAQPFGLPPLALTT